MTSEPYRYLVASAMLILPVACGNGDEAVFGTATTQTADSVDQTNTTVASTDSPPTTTGDAAPVGGTFPAASELLVSFTYQPSTSGKAERPYVAVWVEDADGNFVDTISLWFQQGDKGTKWLNSLSKWDRASGRDDLTISGATRVPGEYTVAWDGTDTNGELIPTGEYVLNVEAAREHGPSSFTSSKITVSADGFSVSLDDDGEISAVNAVLAT